MPIYDLSGALFNLQIGNAPINVRWFGAKGDFSQEDTWAIQSAVNAAKQVPFVYPGHAGTVYLPTGIYVVTGIDLDASVSLRGDGPLSSQLYLKNGSNRSVIRVLPRTNNSDFIVASEELSTIASIGIHGNNQNNSSGHGIELSDSWVNSMTSYHSGAHIYDVYSYFCAGKALQVGNNRNLLFIDNCKLGLSRGGAAEIRGYDHRISNTDFIGQNKDGNGNTVQFDNTLNLYPGWQDGVGSIAFIGCNIFDAPEAYSTIAIGAAGGFITFTGCQIDGGGTKQQVIYVQPVAGQRSIQIIGGRITCDHHIGSMIHLGTPQYNNALTVVGTLFESHNNINADYLIYCDNGGNRVSVQGIAYDQYVRPFGVAITNAILDGYINADAAPSSTWDSQGSYGEVRATTAGELFVKVFGGWRKFVGVTF